MNRFLYAALFTVTVLGTAAAAAQSSEFRYTYLQGGYTNVDLDTPSADGDGLFLGGSLLVADILVLSADFTYIDFTRGIDTRALELGVGVPLPVRPGFDAIVRAGYIDGRIKTPGVNIDNDGWFVGLGGRWMATEVIELNGEVQFRDLDVLNDDFAFRVGGIWNARPDLGVIAGLEFADDTTALQIGFRYNFLR
jgi:hypothetical protein